MIVTGDLIDCARPGDEVDLTGRYTNNFDMSLNTRNGFPVFSTVIEANNVITRKDVMGSQVLSQEDIQQVGLFETDDDKIKELAADEKNPLAKTIYETMKKNQELLHSSFSMMM